jgi:hypothetical protein
MSMDVVVKGDRTVDCGGVAAVDWVELYGEK